MKIERLVHRLILRPHYKFNNSMQYVACHQPVFPALVDKLPVFLRNPQVHYRPLVPVLNQASPIHALLSYFCQVILISFSFLRYDCQVVSFFLCTSCAKHKPPTNSLGLASLITRGESYTNNTSATNQQTNQQTN